MHGRPASCISIALCACAGLPNTAPIVPASIDPPLLSIAIPPAQNVIPPSQQALLAVSGAIQGQTSARIQSDATPTSVPAGTSTFLTTPASPDALQQIIAQLTALGVPSLEEVRLYLPCCSSLVLA